MVHFWEVVSGQPPPGCPRDIPSAMDPVQPRPAVAHAIAERNWRTDMALNLSQKQVVVAELAELAGKAHSLVAAEYAGTTVSQMTEMRKKARETGVYLKVVKNTLASRAVAGTEFEVVQDKLVGPLLYAFSTEEPG